MSSSTTDNSNAGNNNNANASGSASSSLSQANLMNTMPSSATDNTNMASSTNASGSTSSSTAAATANNTLSAPTTAMILSTARTNTGLLSGNRNWEDMTPEVRVYVYRALFRSEPGRKIVLRCHEAEYGDCGVGKLRIDKEKSDRLPMPVAAFHLAKHVHQEASPWLYKCNDFVILWNADVINWRWRQTFSVHLDRVTIDCADRLGSPWGMAEGIKALAGSMTGLAKVEVAVGHTYRLLAAALELSDAVTTCAAAAWGTPALFLDVHVLKPRAYAAEKRSLEADNAEVNAVAVAIVPAPSQLRQIYPPGVAATWDDGDGRHRKAVLAAATRPNLGEVRLSGRVFAWMVATLEKHRCGAGECAWVKQSETTDPALLPATATKTIHYKWTRLPGVATTTTNVPALDMRQWWLPMSRREKERYHPFFADLA